MLVGVELSFGLKSETIYTSELFILGISSPVRTCELVELERVLWYLVRELDMRPLTHIDECRSREFTETGESCIDWIVELPDIGIKSDNSLSLCCEILDHLELVDLTKCSRECLRISDGERELLEFLSFADDRLHLFLDILELRFL